jgi:hypothetical protein
MNAVCHWGLQAMLPRDYTKDQVIGNLRMLVRLGFAERIVEVISGKALEFTLENNAVSIDELENESNLLKNSELVISIWEHDEGLIDVRYWKDISPDGATLFLPSEEDYFEQIENIPGPPVYAESIGNVIERIDRILLETPPGLSDGYRDAVFEIRKTFYTALKFNFVVVVEGVNR